MSWPLGRWLAPDAVERRRARLRALGEPGVRLRGLLAGVAGGVVLGLGLAGARYLLSPELPAWRVRMGLVHGLEMGLVGGLLYGIGLGHAVWARATRPPGPVRGRPGAPT